MIFHHSVQFSSVAHSCPTLCNPMNRSTPGLPVHHQLPEFLRLTSIESVMPSNHLILCRPLLLLPPIPPSIRVFSNESTLRMRWPKFILKKDPRTPALILEIKMVTHSSLQEDEASVNGEPRHFFSAHERSHLSDPRTLLPKWELLQDLRLKGMT